MGQAALRIRLLGGLDVEGLDTSRFGSRKARTLLKRLALDGGRPVPVDSLVGTLWPDGGGPERPAEQVSVLVSRLRRALGSDAIAYSDGAYTLAVDWLDVDELRERVDDASRRLADGNPALARAAASAALALVRGSLLPEEADEAWTQTMRSAVDRLIARARHLAAEGALDGGLPWEATEHAAAALAADRYDEAALRLLMRGHVATGRPALALAAYAETAKLVAADLGVDLSPETQALHVEVLRGDLLASVSTPVKPIEPLIGRDRELAALTAAFTRARGGSAVVVTLEGEAGIGKTRLLGAFAERVAGSAEVLRGTAETAGVLPMEPILEAVARRLATMAEDERGTLLGPEADLLGPLLRPGTTPILPAYRELLMAYEPGEPSAPAVLHLALLAVVTRLCRRGPVVLLLDDAHQADPATVAWLGLVARRGTGVPLLAVAARRPDDGPAMSEEVIVLDRLDAVTAASVVAPYVDPERLDAVVERSAGLPLFLVELAHAAGSNLPDSVREAVAGRLADAGPAGTTLHAAAVLGHDVDVDLLATVLERPASELLDHLDEGARRRILDDASVGYVFRHELVREALDADTPSARRAWLHRQAAVALAQRGPTEQLRIAHHARLGGDVALAAKAFCAAAEQSGTRFDHAEALRLTEESLRLNETAEAHLVRARSLVLLRRYDEARIEAQQARALGAGPVALEVAAFAAYYARDLDSVIRLADEAIATSDDVEVLDTCQFLAIKVLNTRGQITEANARIAPIAAVPTRSRIAPFVRTWRSFSHLHRGHLADAEADLAGAELARQAPVPYASLYLDQFTTHLASLQGRPVDALAIAERMKATTEAQQALRFIGRADVYRGWALSVLGDPAAADRLEEAREIARSAGNPEPLGQGSLDLASLRLDQGDPAAAAALLAEVDDLLRVEGDVSNGWRIELRASYLRGRLALLVGDASAAADAAADVVARAEVEAHDRYEVLGTLLGLDAAAAGGERVKAADVASLLPMLLATARPEAWRVAARLGHRLGSADLLAWSAARVDELIMNAGPWADHTRRLAAAALSEGR